MSDEFEDQVMAFAVQLEASYAEAFPAIVAETKNSIVEGSAETSSPGQPVETGNLHNSWQAEFTGPDEAIISTNVAYAKPIEEGIGRFGPLTLRSRVGGFHSVKLTMAGFQRLVNGVVRRLNAG